MNHECRVPPKAGVAQRAPTGGSGGTVNGESAAVASSGLPQAAMALSAAGWEAGEQGPPAGTTSSAFLQGVHHQAQGMHMNPLRIASEMNVGHLM